MGALIRDQYDRGISSGPASLKTGIRDIPSDTEWMIITHQGKRLGHVSYSIQNRKERGYRIQSDATIHTALAGMEAHIILNNTVQLDTVFRLEAFDFRLLSGSSVTRIKGTKTGPRLHVTLLQGRDSTVKDIEVPEDLYSYLGVQPMVSWRGFEAGDRIQVPAFDPVSLKMGEMTVVHEGKETLNLAGKTYRLNKLRVDFRGIPSILWLDDNGLTFREESILGLVMERSTADEAQEADSATVGLDLVDAYAVPVDIPILQPTDLTDLLIEVEGVEPETMRHLSSPRQQVVSQDPLGLHLRPVAVPDHDAQTDPYLQSTPIIQCQHPQIIEQVKKLISHNQSPEERVAILTRWVYNSLRKYPTVSLSSAVEILETRQGDCSEHTILFTTLARSAGIPTKIHIGLVYLEGRFLYHAWPVVYLDGEWIAVDPTLGQPIADATHIVFLEGDFTHLEQLIPILGRVRIRVLDQQKGKEQS